MNDDNFLMRCGRRLEHSCLVLSAADVADRGEIAPMTQPLVEAPHLLCPTEEKAKQNLERR